MKPLAPTARCDYDVVVVGGGPAGATAAADLALAGHRVLLLDRENRIKPCGGAIPTRLIEDFAIPAELLTARVHSARIVAPSDRHVDMTIAGGFVGMVDRDTFDPWLRRRAALAGATVLAARFESVSSAKDGDLRIAFRPAGPASAREELSARMIVGADGANSTVRRLLFGPETRPPYVFAYHEVVRAPPSGRNASASDPQCCHVFYGRNVSPDFYGWVFPHGDTISIGTGSAIKGFDLREATKRLRLACGLSASETLRTEGAPLPLRPLRRWDDGRRALLAGDAAGVVAPASGEGIYYAMLSGRLAADAAGRFVESGDAGVLADARRRFMREHGRVFLVLRAMQGFWYRSDKRRERFAALCADPDIQRLVWDSYLNKRLVRADPLSYCRVFLKDMAHVLRLGFQ